MIKKPNTILFLSACILLGISFFSLMYGSYEMSLTRIFYTLLRKGTSSEMVAIWGIRLPRILVATFIGVALSCSGCIMQGVTSNPLAEPGIVGINAGATLAVVIYIATQTTTYYNSLNAGTLLLTPLVAILGGVVTSLMIYLLSYKKGSFGKNRIILVGVGVNIAISSIVILFQLSMNKGDYNRALTWTSGSLWGTGFLYFFMIAPATLIIFVFLMYQSRFLDVLSFGDEVATGLGVNVAKQRKKFLLLAVLLAALSVAVAGNISFVGLIGPHIANRLVGSSHFRKLPIAALISASLVILADTLSRNLFSPIEIPVGITLSLIGVPYFIYLLMK